MSEKLEYVIEDSTIAELLGVQNFTNKESAILELVKNSYDAGATQLKIHFFKDSLILEDDGKGMNIYDIKEKWMHVGKSSKENEYSFFDKENKERVYSGSKGIGRFALARLGKEVELITSTGIDETVIWETDWNYSRSKIIERNRKNGTKIAIFGLRDRWTKVNIERLKKYLSRTFKEMVMKILVEFEDEVTEIEKFFSEPKLGINCLSIIKFKYSSSDKMLECIVMSDEFREEAKLYYTGNLNFHKVILDMYSEFSSKEGEEKDIQLDGILNELGDFKGEFYFKISPNEIEAEKFLYKYVKMDEKYEPGIILYRNLFSISSYDGKKDWIGLGKRSRKSPAAATHPTGDWKVRENNIAGKIEIDKQINNMLRDLSNRQGLEENEYYEYFLKIIERVLEVFEEYRQSIIREINKKNKIEETPEEEILNKFIHNPLSLEKEEEKMKLKNEIINLQEREKKHKEELKETEKIFKYDARILNVLSTLGLKATSIAHDMQNTRNAISSVCNDLKEAFILHGVWEILNKEENKKIGAYNVPKMLVDTDKINKKLSIFIGTLLQNVKKSQFKEENLNIYKVLNEIKNIWERDYGILNINLLVDENLEFKSSEDIFKVIFDNLILNSFQQNKTKDNLEISIQVEKNENYLEIIYQDNGKGLHEKYRKNPKRILKVHETSRSDGHGLGMWITNNTIVKTSGEIKEIKNLLENGENRGFEIKFTLGSEE